MRMGNKKKIKVGAGDWIHLSPQSFWCTDKLRMIMCRIVILNNHLQRELREFALRRTRLQLQHVKSLTELDRNWTVTSVYNTAIDCKDMRCSEQRAEQRVKTKMKLSSAPLLFFSAATSILPLEEEKKFNFAWVHKHKPEPVESEGMKCLCYTSFSGFDQLKNKKINLCSALTELSLQPQQGCL